MTSKLTDSQLLFRLQEFYGAEKDASEIGDHEFAQECADIVRVIRELQEYRLATMNSQPVGFVWKNECGEDVAVLGKPPAAWGKYATPLLYAVPQPAPGSCAIADVIAERQRQQSVEGFSTEQDDTYVGCQLAAAAICYIEPMEAMSYWPADWHDDSFKPTNERRNLVKAAALIIAEIERIDRKSDAELKNE
ncbi:TPA: hypothetical protein ACTYDR_004821 [Klebsiella pneumoniae]